MRSSTPISKPGLNEIDTDANDSIQDRQILGPQFQAGEDDDGQEHATEDEPEL